MKRITFVFSFMFILLLITAGCGLFGSKDSPELHFNLLFKYGVGARNILDTYAGTYTKDLVLDPPVTTELSLTQEEQNSIYQKMVAINFFEYPDTFSIIVDSEEHGFFTPFSTYYFNVAYNSTTKELLWEDKIFAEDEQADKLRELINFIIEIIESKDAYKKLPPPTGGYL